LTIPEQRCWVTCDPIEGLPVGQHPLVKRLMKGIYNSRPPQSWYSNTWDASKVLKYLASLGVFPQDPIREVIPIDGFNGS